MHLSSNREPCARLALDALADKATYCTTPQIRHCGLEVHFLQIAQDMDKVVFNKGDNLLEQGAPQSR